MADRSHHTPVRITDKRGRRTTVCRNGAMSAAATAQSTAPLSPAALREPKPLTAEEQEEAAAKLARTGGVAADKVRAVLVAEPVGRTAAALAAEAVAHGTLTRAEVTSFLLHGVRQSAAADRAREGSGPEVGAALAHDLLLIGARVAIRHPQRGTRWAGELVEAAKGARSIHPEPVHTEARLDSLAAVTAFIMADRLRNFTYEDRGVGPGKHRSVSNRDLDGILRERPHDLDRILQYIEERSIRTLTSAEDMGQLREWLDTTEAALGDGWL